MRALFTISLFLVVEFIASSPAQAWENHALATAIALSAMPEVVNAPKVPAESFEDFLRAERVGLIKLLQREEAWARANVANYPSRPSSLEFGAGPETQSLQTRFLNAIRVNPGSKFNLYLQELPGAKMSEVTYLPLEDVTLLPHSLPTATEHHFVALVPGQMVEPISVFTTATDEPDYGLDIKLWEGSGTEFGRRYRFGEQPFGNPELEFSSQAPFHMGFYHEDGVINLAAQFLTRTLPEYRMHLFYALSQFAFQSGHPYWGWRFAGMGAHYVQDLTQPFHTTVLPGESSAKLLLYGFLDKIGIHGPHDELVKQASDQHLAIENQVYCTLVKALERHDDELPIVKALRENQEHVRWPFSVSYVRQVLTSESNRFAQGVATAMQQIMPSKAQAQAVHERDKTDTASCSMNLVSKKTDRLLTKLMTNFGKHTRNWVRTVLSKPEHKGQLANVRNR